ncbi:PREDICTED: THO complex subunit 7 homolog, partial [Calidris pugnax]|uniref:THO complex subunit 7 homolog n=1 Tax=Calidris pugnax TaxID=198806 RepID=UPI00071C7E7C
NGSLKAWGGTRARARDAAAIKQEVFGFVFFFFPSDEVIRKRLLIDGDGAGDDRRINLLVKSFIKWCNSGSQEEGYSQYQRMLSTLSQCEFSMGKTLLVYDMNLREMENYEKIYKDIENSIAAAHEKISECKKQILQAKRIRKNRQEYDALAKVIQHHPDRHETLK